MPWNAPNPAPKCPMCDNSVFPAESYMAADRMPFTSSVSRNGGHIYRVQ